MTLDALIHNYLIWFQLEKLNEEEYEEFIQSADQLGLSHSSTHTYIHTQVLLFSRSVQLLDTCVHETLFNSASFWPMELEVCLWGIIYYNGAKWIRVPLRGTET